MQLVTDLLSIDCLPQKCTIDQGLKLKRSEWLQAMMCICYNEQCIKHRDLEFKSFSEINPNLVTTGPLSTHIPLVTHQLLSYIFLAYPSN